MSTDMIWQTVSTSSADTERLGQLLGQRLQPPAMLELVGDLGAGKTTFVRGLAHGLGSKDKVSSPSFTLSNIYTAKNSEIHHFDLYRLDEPGIIADQMAESVNDSEAITVVEWSDKARNILPGNRLTINFELLPLTADERRVVLEYDENMAGLIRYLETKWRK